jgi:ribosomal protein S20
MNKKQRNKKSVAQNKRNRRINRHYYSTIKNLIKAFEIKIRDHFSLEDLDNIDIFPQSTYCTSNKFKDSHRNLRKLQNDINSVIDKAVKKGILHKNNAARKKSKVLSLWLDTRPEDYNYS